MPKKMLWKVGVYSRLSECLIRDGRDSAARRVVSDTDTPKISPSFAFFFVNSRLEIKKLCLKISQKDLKGPLRY